MAVFEVDAKLMWEDAGKPIEVDSCHCPVCQMDKMLSGKHFQIHGCDTLASNKALVDELAEFFVSELEYDDPQMASTFFMRFNRAIICRNENGKETTYLIDAVVACDNEDCDHYGMEIYVSENHDYSIYEKPQDGEMTIEFIGFCPIPNEVEE